MTRLDDSERSSDPGPASKEESRFADLVRRLERERPVPRAGFRASLRSRLLEADSERASAGARVRVQVAAYAGSGVALLIVAALGVSGLGPLSAG